MDTNQNEFFQHTVPSSSASISEAETQTGSAESYHFWAEESAAAAEENITAEDHASAVFPQEDKTPRKKKPHTGIKKFFACVGLAVCFGIVSGIAFFGVKHAYSYFFPEEAEKYEEVQSKSDVLSGKQNITIAATALSEVGETDASEAVADVVEKTMPAMVSIQAVYSTTSYYFGRPIVSESEGGGSGIIVGSNDDDLLIATNYHVIEDTSSLEAILADGSVHTVSVKGSDAAADLAILALPLSDLTEETMSQIDIAVLGDSDKTRIGQMVIAIGNALGYGPSVTVGYLSAKDREVSIDGNDMILLQTNAAINSGNSGGALLNTKGEVIGINNAKLSSTEIEGICFAIPISKAIPILDDLMTREILTDEEKGYLGISVRELDSAVFQLYNWPEGVYVSAVTEGSAAENAGIYPGDIITHVNGSQVTTANQLVNAVTSHRYGTTIEITLQRINEGQFTEHTFSITLQQNPELITEEAKNTEKSNDEALTDTTPSIVSPDRPEKKR